MPNLYLVSRILNGFGLSICVAGTVYAIAVRPSSWPLLICFGLAIGVLASYLEKKYWSTALASSELVGEQRIAALFTYLNTNAFTGLILPLGNEKIISDFANILARRTSSLEARELRMFKMLFDKPYSASEPCFQLFCALIHRLRQDMAVGLPALEKAAASFTPFAWQKYLQEIIISAPLPKEVAGTTTKAFVASSDPSAKQGKA